MTFLPSTLPFIALTHASQASTSLAMRSRTRQKQKGSQRWPRERVMEFLDCRITLCGISTRRRSLETLRYIFFSSFSGCFPPPLFFSSPEMCNFYSPFHRHHHHHCLSYFCFDLLVFLVGDVGVFLVLGSLLPVMILIWKGKVENGGKNDSLQYAEHGDCNAAQRDRTFKQA